MKMLKILLPQLLVLSSFFFGCTDNNNKPQQNNSDTNISCDKWLLNYQYCDDSVKIVKTKIESLIYDSNKNLIERETDNLNSFFGMLGDDEEYHKFGKICNRIKYRYDDKKQLTHIDRYLNDSLIQSISVAYKYDEYSYKEGDAYQIGHRKVEELFMSGANVVSKISYIYNNNKLTEIIKNESDNNEIIKLIYAKPEYSNELRLVKKIINRSGWITEQIINSDLLVEKEISGLSEYNYFYDCNNNLIGKYGLENHGGYFVQTILRNANKLIEEITFTMEGSRIYKEIYEYKNL